MPPEVNQTKKSNRNLHLHIGGLLLVIIVVLVMFKVNVEKAINSPQFQNNIHYVEEKAEGIWHGYLKKPILWIWSNLFSDILTKGAEYTKKHGLKLQNPDINNQQGLEEDLRTEQIKHNLGGMQGEKTSGNQGVSGN